MSKSNRIILAIETSCDDTGIAIYRDNLELSSVVHSQLDVHNQYGGVVPEIASRNHIMALPNTINLAIQQANVSLRQVDCIACTYGAGLQGALLAGLSYAKALSYALEIPLVPINHIQAHIAVNFVNVDPPFLCLVVSGGHTSIVMVSDYNNYKVLDSTTDDAMGECFDKIARVLGLGYPGGPVVEKHSMQGSPNINFFKHADTRNMGLSFSGLKTATINYIRRLNCTQLAKQLDDICASFSQHAIDIVVNNTLKQLQNLDNIKCLALAGGVAANKQLQSSLRQVLSQYNIQLVTPHIRYCTDNACMVALCAYYQSVQYGNCGEMSLDLNVVSGLPIEIGALSR
jgi:N6-L-threonylcarbamoyladenine synthase